MRPLIASLLLFSALFLQAAQAADTLQVSNAWVRATAPGQKVGAAYLTLTSRQGMTVLKVESSAAETVEIHKMSMDDGIMKMRMLETLRLEADQPFELKPGGFHLMLFNLHEPLKAGGQVNFRLHLRDDSGALHELHLTAPIKAAQH